MSWCNFAVPILETVEEIIFNYLTLLEEEKMAKAKLGSGERFKALTKKIEKSGKSAESAKAIAASVGRKKYGAKKMASMAAKGRKK